MGLYLWSWKKGFTCRREGSGWCGWRHEWVSGRLFWGHRASAQVFSHCLDAPSPFSQPLPAQQTFSTGWFRKLDPSPAQSVQGQEEAFCFEFSRRKGLRQRHCSLVQRTVPSATKLLTRSLTVTHVLGERRTLVF